MSVLPPSTTEPPSTALGHPSSVICPRPPISHQVMSMLRNSIYYRLKPFIPQPIRTVVRQRIAARVRLNVAHKWPILPGSERPPENWTGWPEGKKFALVLTHDVESAVGLRKCRELMQLEMGFGLRSSFNFVPEGGYRVPIELREELTRNGFEIGIHDLRHDGRLFASRREFDRSTPRINHYLKDWGAVGFRSGFMFHNLEWLHALNIDYDMSTFDTDPFEPQPEGRHTIFPFWVPAPASQRSEVSLPSRSLERRLEVRGQTSAASVPDLRHVSASNGGYVELPYTLPQDSTLFLLLKERSIDLWKQKVDWIAQNGGMILLDTHPDYMRLKGEGGNHSYPIEFYEEVLTYVRSKYAESYWQPLPREAANFVRHAQPLKDNGDGSNGRRRSRSRAHKGKIWIDLDNTPHVPFFEPIVDELKARGFSLFLTARDAFQVCDLADKKGFDYTKIGRHHGRNRLLKASGLAYRALQLAPLVLREKPVLGLSHGSRSQLLLSNVLGIPTVLIEDYEFSSFPVMMRPGWIVAPAVIPDNALPLRNGHIRKYAGIKEDVYAWKLKPDAALLRDLNLSESDLIVTVRPPATEAHYHNPESEKLFERFMQRACATPSVKVVLLPRNQKQAHHLIRQWPDWFAHGRVVIPGSAVDGLNLLWHSDLVVSGGGTMNREAAALSVPVYSIFRGAIGAVDRHLCANDRLILIESLEDVDSRIRLVKRCRKSISQVTSQRTLCQIVDYVEEIAHSVVSLPSRSLERRLVVSS